MLSRMQGDGAEETREPSLNRPVPLIHRVEYPELWDVRTELTALSKADGA